MAHYFNDSITDVFGRISAKRDILSSSRISVPRISYDDCYECYLTGMGNKIVRVKAGYAMADTLIFKSKEDEHIYNKSLDVSVKQALLWMMTFGRGLIVVMNKGDRLSDPFDRSKVNEYTQVKVFSGDMVSIKKADRDLYSTRYMKPRVYQVRGHDIHYTRVVDFTYIMPREQELPAYRYGGISEFQFIVSQLKNDLIVERASARIIERNSNLFYKIEGFKDAIRSKKEDDVVKYFSILEDHRSIYGAGLLDSSDDVISVEQALSNLSEIDQITLRRLAAVSNIPVSELVGENVRGLNSTGDNERSSFHAYIKSFQDEFIYSPINKLGHMFGLGEIYFKETQGITANEQADYDAKVATTAKTLYDIGEDYESYLANKGVIALDSESSFLRFDETNNEKGVPHGEKREEA